MDTLRGNQSAGDPFSHTDNEYELLGAPGVHELEAEAPPPVIGKDERRMQVRAYNFWAAELGDRNFPDITRLDPARAGDFSAHGVLLDFSHGIENPRIAFIGNALAAECDAEGAVIEWLSDVPSRSLLSRITDHYMQILANQAPIGFEAEFVNQRGATILYRGILLPYSSDDSTIDYIYGVINWKEMADQKTADELLLEIDQVLEPAAPARRREVAPIADWADGPGASDDIAEIAQFDELGDDEMNAGAPFPAATAEADEELSLCDWLAIARDQAASALDREDRSRSALYDAIGRAWDFALAAAAAPEEFAELLEDAGLAMQERAPMTPVVKLVFGSAYDKTRLTEYAAALGHAKRIGLGRGALAAYLRDTDGGLKGVVAQERAFRREDAGSPPRPARDVPKKAIARRLRSLAQRSLAAVATEGHEFALVMVRRGENGDVALLGEVPNDVALIERAARQLLG
jgi:hypothetical protein